MQNVTEITVLSSYYIALILLIVLLASEAAMSINEKMKNQKINFKHKKTMPIKHLLIAAALAIAIVSAISLLFNNF